MFYADLNSDGILENIRHRDKPAPNGLTRVELSEWPKDNTLGPFTYEAATKLAVPNAENTANHKKDRILSLVRRKQELEAASTYADYTVELAEVEQELQELSQ